MPKHNMEDLQQRQALPLKLKIAMTKLRIREWIDWYGESGVYVAFSGGKDSTVLLELVRQEFPGVLGVFVDTGLEYPQVRDFVKRQENILWIKPKKTFKQVIDEYGYPLISKEVSEKVYYAQRYLKWLENKDNFDRPIKRSHPTTYGIAELLGVPRGSEERKQMLKTGIIPQELIDSLTDTKEGSPHREKGARAERTQAFDYTRWKWLIKSPYPISNTCCSVMKKAPAKLYGKKSGRVAITGQMASESRLRTRQWMNNGCNGFDLKRPVSNPMSFWTEQDVFAYIYLNNLEIAEVYGDVVIDRDVSGAFDETELRDNLGDMGLFDANRPVFKTTGCDRTGCMFCAYGCHLDKGEGRFERLKRTHPKQYDYIMRPKEEGGLNYKEVIDWLNEHGNLNIKY